MNMVKAKVVKHPRDWNWSSHHELCGNRFRYRLLDIDMLLRKLRCGSMYEFLPWYNRTIEEILSRPVSRVPFWTESSCVGDWDFVSGFVEKRRIDDIVSVDGETFYI